MAEGKSEEVIAVDVPARCISMISFARDSVTEVNRVVVHRKCVETWRAVRFALWHLSFRWTTVMEYGLRNLSFACMW